MGKIIGIDLGTTNSAMAVLEGGEPTIIPNAEGGRTTPSVVAFTKTGEQLVGTVAKRQAVTNPENTVFSIKRFMGRKFSNVSEEMKIVPYKVVEGPNSDVRVKVKDGQFSPPEISAKILQKLKRDAEAFLGTEVTEAVITVPAYFDDAQRQATKDAGIIAGLEVKRIVNEPTAASLAYGLDKEHEQTVLVFDLGGGTFDVSILELGDGVFEVKSTNGDTHLGGDNFDKAIVDWIVTEFRKEKGVDLSKDRQALQRLYEAAEKAKVELSSVLETSINQPFITMDQSGPLHLEMTLTRAKLEELTRDLLDRVVGPTKQAMDDAGLKTGDIDQVILVGGMTRMPAVQEKVRSLTGKEPHKGINPDEVVALGAAIQGGVLGRRGQGHHPPRRDPALSGYRDQGRCVHPADRPQHHHPHPQERDLLDGRRRADLGGDPRAAGRARPGRVQQDLGQVPAHGHPAGAARYPPDRGGFDIDANGITHVSAKDMATGNEQKIVIKSSSGLGDDEIKKMVRDAEVTQRKTARRRNWSTRGTRPRTWCTPPASRSRISATRWTAATRGDIENAMRDLEEAIKGDNIDLIKSRTEKLQEAAYKLSEAAYQAAQAQHAGTAGGAGDGSQTSGAGPAEDEIVEEADYEVIDEDK
jgi:molecular chaperone DnaK